MMGLPTLFCNLLSHGSAREHTSSGSALGSQKSLSVPALAQVRLGCLCPSTEIYSEGCAQPFHDRTCRAKLAADSSAQETLL